MRRSSTCTRLKRRFWTRISLKLWHKYLDIRVIARRLLVVAIGARTWLRELLRGGAPTVSLRCCRHILEELFLESGVHPRRPRTLMAQCPQHFLSLPCFSRSY